MESDAQPNLNQNVKRSHPATPPPSNHASATATPPLAANIKSEIPDKDADSTGDPGNGDSGITTSNNNAAKRRCVSTACIACRKRKSKCDGQSPKCAACASVYLTQCQYAPHTDHRRKGVYKKDMDGLKTKNSTLQTLIHTILDSEEETAMELVRQIRACENLESLADAINAKADGRQDKDEPPDSPVYPSTSSQDVPRFEAELSGKMGDLILQDGVKFIGGTSNLLWLPNQSHTNGSAERGMQVKSPTTNDDPVLSWTSVTQDKELILHLIRMYFAWHYVYFTTLSKDLFYRDFYRRSSTQYCSSLLVNAMLTLGCHFTARPAAREVADDSATTGDHFFREAKRLMYENDEFATPKLCTVQALALMSVREAGCGREGKGWVYSGMSFRLAIDLGLNVDGSGLAPDAALSAEDIDARRITFWGCFLFDKCWSNYLGRPPQLPYSSITMPKPDIFPSEDGETWSPYTDAGVCSANQQPARTRAVARYISQLSEISSDLLMSFYHPSQLDKPPGKQAELKKLCDLHTRLEAWKKDLPQEMDPRDGQLPQVLLMHMFFQLLFIHIYRPFLKYNRNTSPLPVHVSPRRFCTQAAAAISKLLRLYKRTYGLRQICNIAVYIAHSACTIHLLNLPDKNAKRDIIHGLRHLEEIGEMWICARRTLRILGMMAEKWESELPDEASVVFARTRSRWGTVEPDISPSPTDPAPARIAAHPPQVLPAPLLDPQVFIRRSNSAAIPYPQGDGFYMTTSPINPDPGPADAPSSDSVMRIKGHPESRRSQARIPAIPELTQAQRDAWNAHSTRLQASTGQTMVSCASTSRATDPAVLFGGAESLVEESQNWWLKDQSALAVGINNWIAPGSAHRRSHSATDWPMAFALPAAPARDGHPIYDYDMNDFPAYASGPSGPDKFPLMTTTSHPP